MPDTCDFLAEARQALATAKTKAEEAKDEIDTNAQMAKNLLDAAISEIDIADSKVEDAEDEQGCSTI